MAEAQGGRVSYAPREGGGSLFVLTLPAANISDAPMEDTRAESL
jgi:signal transduction histidine kinase